MTPRERIVLLVVADTPLRHLLIAELLRPGGTGIAPAQLPFAASIDEASRSAARLGPAVILLEDSVAGEDALDPVVRELIPFAPVVVLASPVRQVELTELVAAGAADFVALIGEFLPLACALVHRRLNAGQRAEQFLDRGLKGLEAADFGEVLRHEVNNPLTGILGNAELLLSRHRQGRNALPSDAVQRLETIAALAVRLRETVHRLSRSLATALPPLCGTGKTAPAAPKLRHPRKSRAARS